MDFTKLLNPHPKLLIFLLVTLSLYSWMYYYDLTPTVYPVFASSPEVHLNVIENNQSEQHDSKDQRKRTENQQKAGYVFYNAKCSFPDLDPFNSEVKSFHKPQKYKSCAPKWGLLTKVKKSGNTATIHIENPSGRNVECCYMNVTRGCARVNPDDGICISACTKFTDNATMPEQIISVKCKGWHEHYTNVHNAVLITESVEKKLNKSTSTEDRHLSVLFIGIDSISRHNLIRQMPKTYEFIKSQNWTEFLGYNKIAENTYPNLMAMLVGLNSSNSYKTCSPVKIGMLDKCGFIWKVFNELNFVTAYAEDETVISTFNYLKKGFSQQPVDYYLRPYMMAAEKLKLVKRDSMTYCTGPESTGERILNAAKDFSVTFRDHRSFGFYWMNTFSHNELNSPSAMDLKVRDFFTDLVSAEVTENSVIIFLSDHGIRFGSYRQTMSGWLEERLPFFFISVPEWFKEKYPERIENLWSNALKLTSPFDVYATLQDVLQINKPNYVKTDPVDCTSAVSLFSEVPSERSCDDACIPDYWCCCRGYELTSKKNPLVQEAAQMILEITKTATRKHWSCRKFKLQRIISAGISNDIVNYYKNETFVLVIIETKPKAHFEATFKVIDAENRQLSLIGGVSRLNYYGDHSKCVSDDYVKKFCYCS